jgi:hypothetical protein
LRGPNNWGSYGNELEPSSGCWVVSWTVW